MPLQIHYAISNFLKNFAYRENIILSSSGASIRSYMYIKDCIVWIIILMFQNNKKLNGTYNIGSHKQISILNLAKKILKLEKNSSRIVVDTKNKNFNYYVPDISRFKNNFEIPKSINLNEALKRTLFHIRNNPNSYFIK
jgi:nucleoside-diphosphate-sugar epimerase